MKQGRGRADARKGGIRSLDLSARKNRRRTFKVLLRFFIYRGQTRTFPRPELSDGMCGNNRRIGRNASSCAVRFRMRPQEMLVNMLLVFGKDEIGREQDNGTAWPGIPIQRRKTVLREKQQALFGTKTPNVSGTGVALFRRSAFLAGGAG